MYDEEDDDELDAPLSAAVAGPRAVGAPSEPMGGGALSALAAPKGLFPDSSPDLIPMPVDPVNPNTKWRSFAGSVLKGHTLAEGLGAATSAYADQENKDAEMRMRYIPLANQARLQRAAQQAAQQKQQQAALENWNRTLIGNTSALLDRPGPIDPSEVAQTVQGVVQRGLVPAPLAEKFLESLPKDPTALRAYLQRSAISMVDPFRAVAKPEFRSVTPGGTLVQTNPAEGGVKSAFTSPVKTGKPSPLAQAIAEVSALEPNDPRRKDYEQLITKLTTHNPNQVSVINPPKPLINELMGGLGTAITAARGNAEGAVGTLNTVARLKDALDSGKVIAGPGTTARVFLGQVGQVMGVPGKGRDEQLTNTRSAIQTMAQLELDAAQAMKGQGAITDAERGIIKRAAAGDIDSMTVPELRVLTNVLERSANYKIGRFRSSLSRIRTIPEHGAAVADMLDIDVPDLTNRTRIRYDANGNPVTQ